jgi:predicted acyltransferase (DUF342 family)
MSLSATTTIFGNIVHWSAPAQKDIAYYKVFRRDDTAAVTDSDFIGEVSHSPKPHFVDLLGNLDNNKTYRYYLKSISEGNQSSIFSNVVTATFSTSIVIGSTSHATILMQGTQIHIESTSTAVDTQSKTWTTTQDFDSGTYDNLSGDNGELSILNAAGTWAAGGALNSGRRYLGGCGTVAAGLSFGGYTGAATNETEEYAGGVWGVAGVGNLGTAKYGLAGCGTQGAGLAFGGLPTAAGTTTEEYGGAAWTVGGSMSVPRQYLGGCGTQAAGLAFGGYINNFKISLTEEYDGSVWSTGGYLITPRYALAGCGTQGAGLSFGGLPTAASTVTEKYSGTNWSTDANMNSGRRYHGGAGTQSLGLAMGGYSAAASNSTEEFDGTSWAAGGNLGTAKYALAAAGTQASGLSFGGLPTAAGTITEEYTQGANTSGTWTIDLDASSISTWENISWSQTGGAVKIRCKSATSIATLGAASWVPDPGSGTAYYTASPTNISADDSRYLRLELALSGGATVQDVTQEWTPIVTSGVTITGQKIYLAGDVVSSLSMTIASLNITGNVSVGGTLHVSGASTFNGTVNISGAVSIGSTLHVCSNATFGGNLTVCGTLTVCGGLTYCGNLTVGGNLVVCGNTSLTGALNVSGAASISNTLHVSGATTFGSTVAISGATTINNNLTVSGVGTVSTLNVTANASVGGTFHASGATTFGSTLTISGITTINNNLLVSGDVTLGHPTSATIIEGDTIKIGSACSTITISSKRIDMDASGGTTLVKAVNVGLRASNTLSLLGDIVTIGPLGGEVMNISTFFQYTHFTSPSIKLGTACSTITIEGKDVIIGGSTGDFTVNSEDINIGTACSTITVEAKSINFSGPVSLSNTLHVSGAATFGSTLNVSGAVTINGTALTAIKLDDWATPDDNADLNATTAEHGLLLKLDGISTNYLSGTGGWTTPAGGTTHAILSSATHTDSQTVAPTQGDLISAQNINSTALWSALNLGYDGQYLKSDGTDALWADIPLSGISDVDPTGPAEGDALVYSTSGTWKPKTLASGGFAINIEEEGAAKINTSASHGYLSFDATDFNVTTGTGTCATVSIVDDGHNHTKFDALSISANFSVGGTLHVSSTTTLGGSLTVSGATIINNTLTVSTLNVTANASVGGTLHVSSGVTLGGALTVSGATTINNNLSVSGVATVSTLNVTANASVGGTFHVSGATTFGLGVTVSGALTVNNTATISYLTVTANASVGGTLHVSGNTTIGGALTVSGALTVNNTATVSYLTVTANASVGGTLHVSGNATFGGTLTVSSAINVSHDSIFIGGDSATNGTWGFIINGNNLEISKREAGVWNVKTEILA